MTVIRYETNPFIEGMIVPVKGQQIRISKFSDSVLLNQSTGSIQATHVTTYKKVDSAQFVKLFSANIAMTFDLSSAGIKTFSVLIWVVQKEAMARDEIPFDAYVLSDFLKNHVNEEKPLRLSMTTFKRGIRELEKAQIIAKTLRQGRYFINPNFVFNGDRIAFTTLIERIKDE